MVYIYLFYEIAHKIDELLIFKKSIASSNTIVITSSVERYIRRQSKTIRHPEHVENTSRTRYEISCKISIITCFGINIGQIVIRRQLPDVFEHVVEHVNTSSNTSRKITVIY